MNAQYLGGGSFLWGGGWTYDGRIEIVSWDGTRQYKAGFSGSAGEYFHHEGRMLDDGTVLMLTGDTNTQGAQSWEGFQVWVADPVTDTASFRWDSQQGVNQGRLKTGSGDVYHANWADVVDGVLYVSLCFSKEVLAVDPGTGEVLWKFGEDGDFEVRDPSGKLLEDELPDC